MKKFFAHIKSFLSIIFGLALLEEIKRLNGSQKYYSAVQDESNRIFKEQFEAQEKNSQEKLETLAKSINSGNMQIYNALSDIYQVVSQKPIVPIVMNDKGYLLNLAVEKKVKLDVTVTGSDVAIFKLIVDHTHTFMDISIDIKLICIENADNEKFKEHLPIMQYARVLFRTSDKKRAILDRIALFAMNKIAVRSQHQIVDQGEAGYLFADTIIQVVKPLYEEEVAKEKAGNPDNQLKDDAKQKALDIVAEAQKRGPRILTDEEMNGVNIQSPENDILESLGEEGLREYQRTGKISGKAIVDSQNESGKAIVDSQNEREFNIIDNRGKVEETKIN